MIGIFSILLFSVNLVAGNLSNTVLGNMLGNYGCWCKFESGQQNNMKGLQVDVFDDHCTRYQANAQCIVMTNGSCDPFTADYQKVFNPADLYTTEEIKTKCAATNPKNWCASEVCQIETQFMTDVFYLIQTGIPPNMVQYSANSGFGFNSEVSCIDTGEDDYDYFLAQCSAVGKNRKMVKNSRGGTVSNL